MEEDPEAVVVMVVMVAKVVKVVMVVIRAMAVIVAITDAVDLAQDPSQSRVLALVQTLVIENEKTHEAGVTVHQSERIPKVEVEAARKLVVR